MGNNNRQYEYVIGIDFGHGETSAALCGLEWDTPVDQLDSAKDLEMGGNQKVIPSAITILENGDAKIGDSAFNPDVLKKAHVNVCFKKAPKDIEGESEQLMIRFMQEVYRRIRENNAALLTDSNHLVYIATPSGWDSTTQQLYVKMAQKAGLPITQKGVTKESRAAFVRAQRDNTSGIGRNIDKGAIVFDMGSSTLDFTYMNKDLPNLIDNGYDCGASHVEKAIFAESEKENEDIVKFVERYPDLRDLLLFEARKVKEQVYFDPSLKVKKTINFDEFTDDEDFEDARYKLSFKPGDLDDFLRNQGYLRMIEEAMLDYKQKFINGQKIYGVFLTGGASRMDFIKDLVAKCWGVPYDSIYRDQDPSLTISQGVAEVARMDLRTDGMDSTLDEDINNLQNSTVVYDAFINNFGGNLFQRITDDVACVINNFASSSSDSSVSQLQNSISNAVTNAIREESARSSEFIEYSINESVQGIQSKVEDIIKHYSQQGMNIQIKPADYAVPKIADINLDGVMDDISNKIAAESGNWSHVISSAAVGFAAGLLLGGPLAWIIAGAWAIFGDKSEEEKKREAMVQPLNQEQRSEVRNGIAQQWDDIQESIRVSILNSLTEDQSIKNAIQKATTELLKSYKENLKSARLLIE